PPKEDAGKAPVAPAVERPPKYDTRLPDAAPATASTPASERTETASTPAATNAPAPTASAAAPVETPKPVANAALAPAAVAIAPAASPASAPAASKAAAEPSHDGYAVQLAAFADDKGANALAGRLKKAGYATYTEPLKTSKGTLWRVRVGPYPSREAALAARDKLKTEGHSGIVAAAH